MLDQQTALQVVSGFNHDFHGLFDADVSVSGDFVSIELWDQEGNHVSSFEDEAELFFFAENTPN